MTERSMLEKVLTTIRGWADRNAEHYVSAIIPSDRTDLSGPFDPLKPHHHYFRLVLAQMFLAKEKNWFRGWHPAVHTTIQLRFGTRTVKISHVTGSSEAIAKGVQRDYHMTTLLPFNGGTVEIDSGLVALKGADHVAAAIGILQSFSSLVAAPLNQTLAVAEKVSSGIQDLFSSADGAVHLAFHREFTSGGGGGNELKPCYIAVVLGTGKEIVADRLRVENSQLLYSGSPGAPAQPLEGYDFMLFRIEGRIERDDWRLPNIEEPLNQAIEATINGDSQTADGYLKAALLAVWQSPDLAVHDRRRVAKAIHDELNEIRDVSGRRGAKPPARRNLHEIVTTRAMSVSKALREPPLTYTELLG